MVIEFNRSGSNSPPGTTTGKTGTARSSGSESGVAASADSTRTPVQTPASGESVNFSQEARQLSQMTGQLQDLPEVDSERVATLKQAISTGSYQVNSQQVATRLLESEHS